MKTITDILDSAILDACHYNDACRIVEEHNFKLVSESCNIDTHTITSKFDSITNDNFYVIMQWEFGYSYPACVEVWGTDENGDEVLV